MKKNDAVKHNSVIELNFSIFVFAGLQLKQFSVSNTIPTLCALAKKINIKSVLQTSYKACQKIAESVLS